MKAFFGQPDAPSYIDCINACTDQTCTDACDAQYPGPSQAFGAVFGCIVNGCPACTSGN
jgi:hypothetical protein